MLLTEVLPHLDWREACVLLCNHEIVREMTPPLLAGIAARRLTLDVALERASSVGNASVVQVLLDHGSNPNYKDASCFRKAVANSHVCVVRLLLDAGADVHARDDIALFFAALISTLQEKNNREDKMVELLKLLLKRGSDVHAKENRALQVACMCGNVIGARILLDAGSNPNAPRGNPLYFATKFGYEEIVCLLLERGADASADASADNGEALKIRVAATRIFQGCSEV